MSRYSQISVMLGAVFIMATSAIGPGFLTQTAVFTEKFQSNLAFAIVASIIIDIGVQLNIWRIIAVSKKRGQEIANLVLPGLGTFIALLIVMGGLAFNIGNVAGAGLGLNVMLGMDPMVGALLSAAFAVGVFAWKEAGAIMDKVAQVMGVVMLLVTAWICFKTNPPVVEVITKVFNPDDVRILIFPMITLIGGTVGGYITFAGGHRLLDAGVSGIENVDNVSKSATTGILVTGAMRILVFLAVLGVVVTGAQLDPANPPASAFQHAAGDLGYKFFGVVIWCAAITSIIGAAYTSVTFLQGFHPIFEEKRNLIIMAFIILSSLCFVSVGRPVTILVIVGSLNSFVLPLALGAMLYAAYQKKIVGDYKHPKSLLFFGLIALAITVVAEYYAVGALIKFWQ